MLSLCSSRPPRGAHLRRIPRRRNRSRRTASGSATPLSLAAPSSLLLLVAGAGSIYLVSEKLGDNVARVENAFAGLDEAARPPATGALTFLLVGTDSRSESTPPGVTANGSGSGADVVMVAHVAPDRRSATVVSIPRDSWVDIPGRGGGRVSAAYAIGGPSLLIKTVESLTALRVDHFAVIDFAGFRSMVDAIGGIDVAARGSRHARHPRWST